MELRLLRYFLAVAREENITRAAEVLHITQPSLSKQMMELEQELGKQLFIRGKRKITLTDEGVLLRKRADEILMLCDKTQREIAQDSDLIGGVISIGGAGSSAVAQATALIANRYPGVKFQFLNGDAETLMERLDHGTLDFGILIEPVDIVKYDHLPLKETDEWGLLMRKDCALASKEVIRPEDIQGIPLILPQRIGLQRELSAWSRIAAEHLNTIATFDILFNNPSLLIKNGLGYAFALRTLVDTSESSTLCFRPLEPAIKIQYGLAWKRYPVFSKAAEKFIEQLKELVE
jgi:DNA-binding transcriptional LysR family regulator